MLINLIRQGSVFIPATDYDQQQIEKIKQRDYVSAEVKRPRNAKFHRKYMALLNYAFENWEPGEIDSKYGKPKKSFDRFRKDLAILSGFYDIEIRLNGETSVTAKSISFASMKEDEFEELYSNTIDVILKRILTNYTKPDLENVVLQIIGYS